jgi:hypothetical protein
MIFDSVSRNEQRFSARGFAASIFFERVGGLRLAHCAGSVWLEQLGQLIRRNGLAEKVPLGFVTIVLPQKLQIFRRFNSLSNDPQVKAPSHVDECFDGSRSTGNGGDLADKRPVDLEGIEG